MQGPVSMAEATRASAEAPAKPARVLLVGGHMYPDGCEWHILDTLRRLGCQAEFFQTQFVSSSAPRALQNAAHKLVNLAFREPELLFEPRLIRTAHRFEPDLILVTLGNQLSPKTVKRLRAHSCAPIVCWCQDQMTTIGRQFMLGAGYDHVFVKDRYMSDLFSRMIRSTQFHYLPEACNPRVHRPLALSAEERGAHACDVMIAGTLYYYRQEILRQLSEFDLKIWGLKPDWLDYRLGIPHPGREAVLDDKARAAAGARVCLNPMHFGEVDGLNCRAFEIAGCGGFQIITAVPVLSEHFRVGAEIVEFRSIDQLKELIRHYLDHPELAAEIAGRGQRRAHADHTYERRLEEIFRIALR